MIKFKKNLDRRNFIKSGSLSSLPFFIPALGQRIGDLNHSQLGNNNGTTPPVNFIFDGLAFSPQEYLQKLLEINESHPISPDFYGNGGATKVLEESFAQLTGKEKAIFLPTGTMANQLAIKLLNGDNTKILVSENSHIYRDEADAAQAVHHKRLIPVGKGKPYFNVQDLEETIIYHNSGEVFKSGLGTIAVEHPVRRANGTAIPLETIKEVSEYCRLKGYNLHLDGARLHIASAYTGVPIAEYATYFDTVYISLYKYLNAASGAILCGDADFINKIVHQIKIYGGTTYQTWSSTAMALHYLTGIGERWTKVIKSAKYLISELNEIAEIDFIEIVNGTNIHNLRINKQVNLKKLTSILSNKYNIWLGRSNHDGIVKFVVNESLLSVNTNELIGAWKESLVMSGK